MNAALKSKPRWGLFNKLEHFANTGMMIIYATDDHWYGRKTGQSSIELVELYTTIEYKLMTNEGISLISRRG